MNKTTHLKLTLKKSLIGRSKAQQSTVRGLGLKKIGSTSIVKATPEHTGMINAVRFMIDVTNTQ
ncbi:MAG: 50S ribosomal protein L30 [Pseudomonadota bacterium]|nr:50S ribosomal protein L30 [Pseudomonadota bacterium]